MLIAAFASSAAGGEPTKCGAYLSLAIWRCLREKPGPEDWARNKFCDLVLAILSIGWWRSGWIDEADGMRFKP